MNLQHDALDDVREAIEALEEAENGLRAMTPEGLVRFEFGVGLALGKLSVARDKLLHIAEALYAPGAPRTISEWTEAKG